MESGTVNAPNAGERDASKRNGVGARGLVSRRSHVVESSLEVFCGRKPRKDPLGGMIVSPWVALINALDEDYIASIAVNAFGGRFFEPGPDRSFQVGLRARFGG